MCTPHKNPRILKSEDFPASNPKIFKILGFDTTVPSTMTEFLHIALVLQHLGPGSQNEGCVDNAATITDYPHRYNALYTISR